MNENAMDQKIIERLQKLLALAASDNEHEAELAMSKAEALMREHNLSVADVALNGSGAYVQTMDVYGLTFSIQKWESQLGASIAWAFNGRAVRFNSSRALSGCGWYFTFVAGRTDLAIIVDLYGRLRDTVKRMGKTYLSQNYRPNSGVSRHILLNSYHLGMLKTIRERLSKLKENTAPDDTTKNAYGLTGKELMVVKDKAVEQRFNQMFPNAKNVRARSSRVLMNAYQQGQADGNRVSLHQSVGGSQGPVTIGR